MPAPRTDCLPGRAHERPLDLRRGCALENLSGVHAYAARNLGDGPVFVGLLTPLRRPALLSVQRERVASEGGQISPLSPKNIAARIILSVRNGSGYRSGTP
jgi:hypothetical protein